MRRENGTNLKRRGHRRPFLAWESASEKEYVLCDAVELLSEDIIGSFRKFVSPSSISNKLRHQRRRRLIHS